MRKAGDVQIRNDHILEMLSLEFQNYLINLLRHI
jgi:hypothetical protein